MFHGMAVMIANRVLLISDDDVKEFLNQLKLSVSIGAFEAFNKRPPYIVAGFVRNICSYKDNK